MDDPAGPRVHDTEEDYADQQADQKPNGNKRHPGWFSQIAGVEVHQKDGQVTQEVKQHCSRNTDCPSHPATLQTPD